MSFDPSNIPGWDPVNGGFGLPADSAPDPVASAAPAGPEYTDEYGTVTPKRQASWSNGAWYMPNSEGNNDLVSNDPGDQRFFDPQNPTLGTTYAGKHPELGLAPFQGQTTYGLRGAADNQWGVELGGENAQWGVNPRTGLEEPVFEGYLLSDLLGHFGSWDAIHEYGANPDAFMGDGTDPYAAQGPFAKRMDVFGARPSNDTFSGKDGLADIISILSMAMPVLTGAAGAAGATSAGGSAAGAGSEAALAGGGEVGSGYAASASQPGMFANIPGWAMNAGTSFGMGMLGGASPAQALQSAAISGGIGAGADFATPYVNDVIDGFQNGMPTDDLRRPTMMADAGTSMFDVAPPTMAPMMPPAIQPDASFKMMAAAQPEVDPTFGGMLTESSPGMFSSAAANTLMPPAVPEQGDPTVVPQEPTPSPAGTPTQRTVSPEQLQRYVKVGQQVNGILGGDAEGPQAPAADASPEEEQQYYQEIVDYLGLDAQTMAEAGLQPGTQEYTDYILDQADAIISQVLGDMDVDAEDLATQLRTKTTEELQALQRALYIRGQLGQRMGSGTYEDPFTGEEQEVIGEGTFDPNTGAYQRGLAQNVNELGGLRGGDAYEYLQGMLGRKGDPFRMQASADERFEQALREQDPEAERRRRGMLGSF